MKHKKGNFRLKTRAEFSVLQDSIKGSLKQSVLVYIFYKMTKTISPKKQIAGLFILSAPRQGTATTRYRAEAG